MISLRFDKNKKEKKINFKVIATSVVAITLIGIVGISIGRYSGSNPIGGEVVLDIVEPVGKNLNRGFTFLKDNFKDIINYKNNSRKVDSLQKENQKLKEITAQQQKNFELAWKLIQQQRAKIEMLETALKVRDLNFPNSEERRTGDQILPINISDIFES